MMNVGEFPSLFCAFDRHAECGERSLKNCTCPCHRLIDPICDTPPEDAQA